MAEPILNFDTKLEGEYNLVLTDTSEYSETILNRYFILTDVKGEINLYVIDDTNEVKIDIDKDYAYLIRLAINYDPVANGQEYSRVKNVLVAPYLTDILYDLRKKFLDLKVKNEDDDVAGKLLNRLELIDSFNEAAISLISTDLVGAQNALDFGNDHANRLKCKI